MNGIEKLKKWFKYPLPYDEWRYWNSRSDPNSSKGWAPGILDTTIEFIHKHTIDCSNVLELGPGVGRTLDAYKPRQKIRAYDISGLYQKQLLSRAQKLNLKIEVDLAKQPGEPLPYENKQFSAGVASQVLMHQRPENIEFVMRELIRCCSKVIVITGYGCGKFKEKHVFDHDYPAICSFLNCEMHYVRSCYKLLFFIYKEIGKENNI